MADIDNTAWSEVADQNTSAPPNGWPEGMERRDVNNCAREMMASIKRFWNRSYPTRASTSAAEVYSVSYTSNPATLTQGLVIAFRADSDCKANAKLKVGSLAAANLKKQTIWGFGNLEARDVMAGQIVAAAYDTQAAAFIILNQIAGSPGMPDYGDIKATVRVGGWNDRSFTGGWLPCDGRLVFRATYPGLFLAIGTNFGAGDGTTTFNLPDFRGRALVGADRMHLDPFLTNQGAAARLPGDMYPSRTLGSATHQLTINEIPSHTHSGTTGPAGNHGHIGTTSGIGDHTHSGVTDAAGQHTHTLAIENAGQHAHQINNDITQAGFGGFGFSSSFPWGPVNAAVTTENGLHFHQGTANAGGQHTHNVGTYGAGAHSHDLNITPGGEHTHSVSGTAAGGGLTHANVQPSMCCNILIYAGQY